MSSASGEGSVRVERGSLSYERAGEGFPVVLIPSTPWDRRIWDPQFPVFAEQHDVVRYDPRGCGSSDRATAPYSDLRDLVTLLEQLDIARCALVGFSLGAQLAIDLALERPELVDAVVAESPLVSGRSWNDPGVFELAGMVQEAASAGELERAMEIELAVWTPLRGAEGDELIRSIAFDNLDSLRQDPELLEPSPPAADRLGEVAAAVLVVVGNEDIGEIHAIADELVAAIPGASKREIAEADHIPHVRKAEKFNRIVLDFLGLRS